MNVTLITGNKGKLKFFKKYIGIQIEHMNLDLDEIQSLDLEEIVKHKVIQAYNIAKKPVIVEDVSLEFKAFGRLPGPFIKFFENEISYQEICDLLDGKSRKAVAHSIIGYYDGKNLKMFEGKLQGTIAKSPSTGNNGFGFDVIFIPEGYNITRSEMNDKEYEKTYLKIKRIDLLKEFLENKNPLI